MPVFVNGVQKTEGDDYVVLSDRVRFDPPLRRERVSRIGSLLLSVGIGVYPKGDIVDVQVRRNGGRCRARRPVDRVAWRRPSRGSRCARADPRARRRR